MKVFNKLIKIFLALIPGYFITSCDNGITVPDNSEYRDPYMASGVVAAPDVVISTGNQILTNTFDDYKIPNTKAVSQTFAIDKNNNTQVEVHLSIGKLNTMLPNLKDKTDAVNTELASQLSMHIRYGGDVEVIIPVPEHLYCDPDSLSLRKQNKNFVYTGEKDCFTNEINGIKFSLYVEYVAAKNDKLTNPNGVSIDELGKFDGGYIRIYTQGITEELFAYTKKEYSDGLNFRIYTYYSVEAIFSEEKGEVIDEDDLRINFLDHSLINFDWENTDVSSKKYPELFVNSFSAEDDGSPIEFECYVRVLGDKEAKIDDNGLYNGNNPQLMNSMTVLWNDNDDKNLNIERNHFQKPFQENHFNSSPYNWIYPWIGLEI